MPLVDWPIGTPDERAASSGDLPGHWVNSNKYMNWYQISDKGPYNWHTGVDLNLNYPHWNDDWHTPIYALAAGRVIYSGPGGGSWGHIVVVGSIDPRTGKPFYWRVGHIEVPRVATGDSVKLSQPIAAVGNGDGYYGQSGAHCHLDISLTDILRQKPNYWPGANKTATLDNFVNPVRFIKDRYMPTQLPPDPAEYARQWFAARPANTSLFIASVPPNREPLGTVDAIELDAATMLALINPQPATPPAPDPHPNPPGDAKPYKVVQAVRVRQAEGVDQPQLNVNGQDAWLAKDGEISGKPTRTVGLFNWLEVFAPYHGFAAIGKVDGSEVYLSPKA